MSTTKKKAEPKLYTATIKVLGKEYSGKGQTILTAIQKLDPGNVNGMSILTVSRGESKKERVIPAYTTKRLFNTAGMAREIILKNISLIFDGV